MCGSLLNEAECEATFFGDPGALRTGSCSWAIFTPVTMASGACSFGEDMGRCLYEEGPGDPGCFGGGYCGSTNGDHHLFYDPESASLVTGMFCVPPSLPGLTACAGGMDVPAECDCACEPTFPHPPP
jgi:hypothetical protein